MPTKPANQDTHNEPSMLYAYARVDLDMKRVRYIINVIVTTYVRKYVYTSL